MKNVIATIVVAASFVATSAAADKCGFMCKLAYGGGHDTVAEAKLAWEGEQKERAAERMDATGKKVLVEGNYIYVDNGDGVTMVAKSDIRGKNKDQIKDIIVEAVTDDVILSTVLEHNNVSEEMLAEAANEAGLTIDEFKHDLVIDAKISLGILEDAANAADAEAAGFNEAFDAANEAASTAVSVNGDIKGLTLGELGEDFVNDALGATIEGSTEGNFLNLDASSVIEDVAYSVEGHIEAITIGASDLEKEFTSFLDEIEEDLVNGEIDQDTYNAAVSEAKQHFEANK